MDSDRQSVSKREKTVEARGPYEDLYIYLIRGRVNEEDEGRLGEAFLGNWVEDGDSFLFFGAPSKERVLDLIKKRGDLELFEDHHFTYDEWQGGGLDPLQIENFLIVPPWCKAVPGDSERRIILDPGVVFGTGLHPTTSDCLRALIYLNRQAPLGRVLDLGTGTGILALAAALLGAQSVLAVDLNPLSVKTAERNVRLNGLQGTIRVVAGDVRDFVSEGAELVLANIHHEVVESLFENPSFRDKGRFVVSGLMRGQAREVKAQLARYGLQILREWDHEGTWYTLSAQGPSG